MRALSELPNTAGRRRAPCRRLAPVQRSRPSPRRAAASRTGRAGAGRARGCFSARGGPGAADVTVVFGAAAAAAGGAAARRCSSAAGAARLSGRSAGGMRLPLLRPPAVPWAAAGYGGVWCGRRVRESPRPAGGRQGGRPLSAPGACGWTPRRCCWPTRCGWRSGPTLTSSCSGGRGTAAMEAAGAWLVRAGWSCPGSLCGAAGGRVFLGVEALDVQRAGFS